MRSRKQKYQRIGIGVSLILASISAVGAVVTLILAYSRFRERYEYLESLTSTNCSILGGNLMDSAGQVADPDGPFTPSGITPFGLRAQFNVSYRLPDGPGGTPSNALATTVPTGIGNSDIDRNDEMLLGFEHDYQVADAELARELRAGVVPCGVPANPVTYAPQYATIPDWRDTVLLHHDEFKAPFYDKYVICVAIGYTLLALTVVTTPILVYLFVCVRRELLQPYSNSVELSELGLPEDRATL